MSDDILREMKNVFGIDDDIGYEFKEVCGLTFVFRTRITRINGEINSAEIRPSGIIYEENDQYYFAPLYRRENINEIVKKYVENLDSP